MYKLTVTTNGNGTYYIDPAKELYISGESATVTAVPNDNYFFSHWSGDINSDVNPLNITINKDTKIKANFGSAKWLTIPDQVINNGKTLTIDLSHYSTCTNLTSLSYEIISGPGSLTDNVFSYSPVNTSGNKEIKILAKELNGYSAETSFNIYVNVVPQWKTIPQQKAYTTETLNLNLSDYVIDTDDDSLDFTIVSGVGSVSDNIYSYNAIKEGNSFDIKIRVYDKYNCYSDISFIIVTLIKPGTQLWDFNTGDAVDSSPAVGEDGTIYVGSDDNLYAVNPDGSLKWAFNTESGVDSSPVIGKDGTIYIFSQIGKLCVVNPDGSLKWAFNTGDNIFSSPAIGYDGTVYVGAYGNKLYAVNPDGSLKWAFNTGDNVTSSPAVGEDGTVYVGSWDEKLYAVNPDGSLKWAFNTGDNIFSSPAVGEDGTVYVGSRNNNLYAVNPDGSKKWAFATGGSVDSSPAIGEDGTVYVGSFDNKLYAVNPDGSLKWSFNTGGSVDSSPAIGEDGTVYVGSDDNKLYAVNPDGSLKWSFATGADVNSSPAIGKDGTIYVGSWDGKLYALKGESGGLADTPWPKFGKNNKNTAALDFTGSVPVWKAIPDQVVTSGESLVLNLSDYSYDSYDKNLFYEIISGSGSVSDNIYSFNSENDTEVIIKATNKYSNSSEISFNINCNNKPSWNNIPDQSVNDGETLVIDLSQYSYDRDNDKLTYEIISGVGFLSNNIYRYSPVNQSGNKEVTLKLTDPYGCSDEISFNIHIN